jgi:hypothetical protein
METKGYPYAREQFSQRVRARLPLLADQSHDLDHGLLRRLPVGEHLAYRKVQPPFPTNPGDEDI